MPGMRTGQLDDLKRFVNARDAQFVDAVPTTAGQEFSVWAAAILAIGLIGYFDYFSGIELRVFPLYYAPISLVAWHRSRSGALIIAGLSTLTWLVSNFLAGLRFDHADIWVANTLMQGASFATVGLLIATLRTALIHERRLSRTDPLTSLLNSRAFYDEAPRILALCRRKERPVTVAYIDLDNFKAVNDKFGHKAGDELLRRVSELLRTSIRPSDIPARLGGDEFAVLFPEVGPRDAAATVERLRSLLAGAFTSSPCPVSSSIGAVTFTTAPADVEEMVGRADSQMYLAKTAGKNRVRHEVA